MKRNFSMQSKNQKAGSTLMELKAAALKLLASALPSTLSEIIITVGKGRNRALLICDSYSNGIALIDKMQSSLDSVPIGKKT